MAEKEENNLMEKIVSLCKRRGFVYPSSEIYGGFSSCYDYGPYGAELESSIKKNVVGLYGSISRRYYWLKFGNIHAS